MKIQEKPDYLIFAESAKKGEVSDFPDVSRGWGITIEQTGSKPTMEWMNGTFNRVDKNMLYLLQQGVPEWSEKVIYPVNAIIKYNGVLYTAIVENDNAQPSTNTTKWKKTLAEIPTASTAKAGVVKLSSATDSASETDAATPLAIKNVNDNAITAKNNANDALNIANSAVRRSGDNMSGDLFVKNQRVIVDGEAFPFRGYLRGSSLNNIRGMQHGVYLQNMNDLANIENGYPIPAAGTLIVTQTGGDGVNGCVQTYTDYYAVRQFIRTYRESSNVWSNWVEQITTANIKNYCSQIVVLYPGGSEGAPSTLRANQRIVIDNPFKTNFVMAWVEFIENNTWYKHDEIIFNGNTGYGTKTNQCGDKIIIQTGNSAVRTRCFHDGNPTGADNIMTSLPYRLIIVKIEA